MNCTNRLFVLEVQDIFRLCVFQHPDFNDKHVISKTFSNLHHNWHHSNYSSLILHSVMCWGRHWQRTSADRLVVEPLLSQTQNCELTLEYNTVHRVGLVEPPIISF